MLTFASAERAAASTLRTNDMSGGKESDAELVERIRRDDEEGWNDAWLELIERYEGRLLAFAESRLGRRQVAEDVVQDTFLGFLTSLPNYDGRRPLEGYLFAICAFKLTDHLRRAGRRPALPWSNVSDSSGNYEPAGHARPASSIIRSGERRHLEENALVAALGEQIARWRERGEWQKIQCAELLLVRGWANKDVAAKLDLSEQQVANIKFDFLARLRTSLSKQALSADWFPELRAEDAGA